MQLPDNLLWQGQNNDVRNQIDDAGCEHVGGHVNGTASPFVERIPDLFSGSALEDLDDCANAVEKDVGPDQAMGYPEHGITLASGYKDTDPV